MPACDTFDTESATENAAPFISLTNIPVEGDTLFALATLHWDGGDTDGFITGYEYRYHSIFCRTRECDQGDSTSSNWSHTEETSKTIAFTSKAPVNKQIFEIRSIDNGGKRSDVATKRFFTLRNVPPTAALTAPADGTDRFAQPQTTDWWQGVPIHFTAEPGTKESSVVEYGWGVNDGPWHWTQDTTVTIPPSVFTSSGKSLEGKHTIQVTARDNTGLVSHEGPGSAARTDTVSITLVRPQFSSDVLVIDETIENANSSNINATDAEVDAFYEKVFHPDRTWDYQAEGGAPPREILGQYKLVIWHADNYYANLSNAHSLPDHTELFIDYMNVGGDFVMSGWRILASFYEEAPTPYTQFSRATNTFEEGSFIRDYLHIVEVAETPRTFPAGNFEGAKVCPDRRNLCSEDGPFPNVLVDTEKLSGATGYLGYLSQINLIIDPANFTRAIYYYQPRDNPDSSIPAGIRFQPVGLRYYGTVFDAAIFGFPLFFLEEEDAQQLGTALLTEMGY